MSVWQTWRAAAALGAMCCAIGWLPSFSVGQDALSAAAAIETALVETIARAEPSVVAIARVRQSERLEVADAFGRLPRPAPPATDPGFVPNDFGAGVVVDRRGLILTHYHVLGENSEYFVTTADRKVYAAKVKAADPRSDLAVLAIDATDLVPIAFGDAATLKKGHIVVSLGNPYAIARDGQASASWGIVSNLGRKTARSESLESPGAARTTLAHLGGLIQTDAKLNLGTSGGPLLNLRGEMVGLVTSLAAAAGYEQAAGFAIPVDDAFKRIVDTLKKGREVEYGLLGIKPHPLPLEKRLAGMHGVLPGEIVQATPAQWAGLLPDDIITHVNSQPIYHPDSLMLHVGREPAGGTVRLSIERRGETVPVVVELAKYAVTGKKIVTSAPPAWRGLRVDWWTADPDRLAETPRPLVPAGYVVAVDVEENSAAWQAGLRPGTAITHVDDAPVTRPAEFHRAIEGDRDVVHLRLASAGPRGVVSETVAVPHSAGE